MAQPPAALKQADSNLFKTANRAVQLASAKPIVTYWCEYYVVNQILARQLHQEDPEILNYTTTLMDKLEEAKTKFAAEEAVMDDDVAKVYIEQFAQDTLDRAQKVIRANKCTQQTANTFDAAATFLNLLSVWGPLDADTKQKIKYAKWNTVRILKAIKEGTDPNESNPKPEPEPAALEADELNNMGVTSPSAGPFPATVEDAPESSSIRGDPSLVSQPQTPASAVAPHQQDSMTLPDAPHGNAGYFDPAATPQPPSIPSPMSPPLQPSAGPGDLPQRWTPTPPAADTAFSPPPPKEENNQYAQNSAPEPATAPPTFAPSPAAMPAVAPPPALVSPPASYMNMAPNPSTVSYGQPSAPAISSNTATAHASTAPTIAPGGYNVDDASVRKAQKHCKWAISALNFEDAATAVRELELALQTLGAR
ncbi:hypothetical protein MGG_06787 [Pyricularia oryzae 70-15]|uniref:Vacuolar protein sorting-associated protein VTA1 n=3 Tax=Pyricularia oryzae TaxID=318829 RepID=G4MM09_PYRO7|nr:uncharacterized protein MGG_06787 [Pyricularia oryzae 70-15]EHA56894.1 hypothetical protein MGG_06787 [Pyricularia oryzae 70-15]ELQ38612.1 hypothetical protein OOU_Y34scaffold00534g87 [Pyricularia oryzae Y34]KAI7912213.1 hypothetical protein M9X92_010140 [Pyricularia oryzae]KAI7912224.1 hypothetical protein M0657_010550 [Pyricularia oryzae]